MPTLQRGGLKFFFGLSPAWKLQSNCTIFTCNGQEISPSICSTYLWKGPATKSDEFLEKLQRGGSHFHPKIYMADFGPL